MMRGAAALGSAALLAACATAPGLPVRPELVGVTGADGIAPVARLHSEIVVRTYLEDASGRREVGGADCVLETAIYSAAFRTPARVLVPVYGAGSPTLRFACRADGLRGAAAQRMLSQPVGPYDGSPWGYPYGGFDTGVVVSVGGPVYWGDRYGYYGAAVRYFYYPDVGVRLE
jgi:hypothetical protein